MVSIADIPAGTVIAADMVSVKRPSPGPDGIPARALTEVIGRTAATAIPKDRQLTKADVGMA